MPTATARPWSTRSLLGICLLAAALVATVATPATAHFEPPAANTEVVPTGFFVEGEQYTLVSGPLFEQGCLDQGFTDTLIRLRETPAGVFTLNTTQKSENLFLIEGSFFSALEAACSAIAAGEASPVEYLAIGQGRTSHSIVENRKGVRFKTTMTGQLETADGAMVRVTAHETFAVSFTDDGVEEEAIVGKVIIH